MFEQVKLKIHLGPLGPRCAQNELEMRKKNHVLGPSGPSTYIPLGPSGPKGITNDLEKHMIPIPVLVRQDQYWNNHNMIGPSGPIMLYPHPTTSVVGCGYRETQYLVR